MPEPDSQPNASPGFPTQPELIFANWREALHRSGLSPQVRTVFSMAIGGYLDYCTNNSISVSVDSARAFMADVKRRGLARNPKLWQDGLNWFYIAGRQRCKVGRPEGVPSLGQADTGALPWEQRLIERLRLQHYSWRTEQTFVRG